MPFAELKYKEPTKNIKMFYRVFDQFRESDHVDPTRPVIIVHHGGMGIVDHQIELEAWKPFSEKTQVIYIDQRGCGKTEDGDPQFWTMNQFGDDIYTFSQTLGIEHPIVGGVSSGGYAALAYATRHPEHPLALMLLNTEPVVSPQLKAEAYRSQGTRADRRQFAPFKQLSDSEIIAYAKEAADAVVAYDENPSQEAFAKFAKFGFSTISKNPYNLPAPCRVNEAMKRVFANGYRKFDYSESTPKIPCRIIWFAGEYDPLHPYVGAVSATRGMQNVELHVLDTGAPVYHDAPKIFYNLANRFLEQVCQKKMEESTGHTSILRSHL